MARGHIQKPYISSGVSVGSVALGGNNPVRIQSMTNTSTLDTRASIAQCIRIIEAGADYVRLAARNIPEAKNLSLIKKGIAAAGYETPLIADTHFNPSVAETAALMVEKIRINPGNYVDRKNRQSGKEISDKEYSGHLERIHNRLLPLIDICRKNETVIRLGINHGSLSERIMMRYGNSVEGMVVSALEFIRIFRSENFHNLVLSLKSSDTGIMIDANRKMVLAMRKEGYSFPLHLGVTEAGEGEDGKIRSAVGIGALLAEGIGDTIRVSLTGDPEKEIPVAKKIADYYPRKITGSEKVDRAGFSTVNRKTTVSFPGKSPLVLADLTSHEELRGETYGDAGYLFDEKNGKVMRNDTSADIIISSAVPEEIPPDIPIAVPYGLWVSRHRESNLHPLILPETNITDAPEPPVMKLLLAGTDMNIEHIGSSDPGKTLVIFSFDADEERYAPDLFLNLLANKNLSYSIILNPLFHEDNLEDLQIKAASLLGRYLAGQTIAGICISNRGSVPLSEITALAFSILHCSGLRITRTIYLSCPTCGRTSFDLEESVKKVKKVTAHLKGMKIAIMGCVVNGPGEMAGADYGYVGAAPGKVHIYRGETAVLKNIPEETAADELVKLINRDMAGEEM